MSAHARAILDAKLALEAELVRPLDQSCMAYIIARQANGDQPLAVYDRMQHASRLEQVLLRHYCRVVMVMTGRRPPIHPEPHVAALSLRHLESMRGRAKRQAELLLTSMDRGFASAAAAVDTPPPDDGTGHAFKSETKEDKPKPVGWIGKFRARIPAVANVQTNGPAEEARFEVVPDGQENGDIVKVWHNVGDDRVRGAPHNPRHSHFDHWTPEGQERPVDEAFEVSGEALQFPGDTSLGASLGNVINCFPGDTRVSGRVTAATRHWYEGELVEITTAGGHKLAGTPNHPVLTPKGWVALGALHKGSHVICRSVGRIGAHGLGSAAALQGEGALHIDDVEPSIEQVFDALAGRKVAMRVPGLAVDFHGDVPASQVEIVKADRELWIGRDPASMEHVAQDVLAPAFLGPRDLLPSRLPRQLIDACAGRSTSSVGGAGNQLALAFGGARKPDDVGLAAASDRYAAIANDAADTLSADTSRPGNGERGLAGEVVRNDRIVSVTRRHVACHVFNLESQRDSYYSANGIVVHNCRCWVNYIFVGKDGKRTDIAKTPAAPARRQKRPDESLQDAKPRLNPTSQITLNGGTRANLVLHDKGKTIAQLRQLKPNLIEVRVNGRVIARAETNPEAGTVTKINVTPKYRSNGSDVEGIIRRSVAGSAEHLARVRNRTP